MWGASTDLGEREGRQGIRSRVSQPPSAGSFGNLVAANGQVIATSEAYEHKQSALHGIESVKENAPGAEVDDQTGE